MVAASAAVGVIGLGVMGSSLCLNIAENASCRVAGFDLSETKTREAVERAKREGNLPLEVYSSMADFVSAIAPPRRIILLVPAGKPVDAALEMLGNLLAAGDTVIDMGNEWYQLTEARQARMAERRIHYMGCGISGGESGARSGPCLMPSGSAQAWAMVAPILESIAARTQDGACVTYLGPGAAGNYVKMVHNGIEYGDMQLIAEAYHLMRAVGGLSNREISAIFERWSRGPLASYLVEITAQILRTKDDAPFEAQAADRERADLVDMIKDSCGSKGTGKWTVQEAAEQGVAAPTMSAALDARYLSSLYEMRARAGGRMAFRQATATRRVFSPMLAIARGLLALACSWSPGLGSLGLRLIGWPLVQSGPCLVDDLEAALYSSKLCSYAQGFSLIQSAAEAKSWQIEPPELARIWKGGCIIRAAMLDDIRGALGRREHPTDSILFDAKLQRELAARQEGWRRVVMRAVESGIPAPALSSSLAFYDTLRQPRLPGAALVQAQRDFFGGHQYERIDQHGSFHTIWTP